MSTPGHDPSSELRRLWLQPGDDAPALDAQALERAAQRLRRRAGWRNLREWGAALVLLPLCARGMARAEQPLTQVGLLAIALAGVYVSVVLYRRGRVSPVVGASTAEFARAHAEQLRRQAALLESVWRWYLLPFVPGLALTYAGAALSVLARGGAAGAWLGLCLGALLTGLVFYGIARLNQRGARALRQQIAALGEP